MLKGRGWIPRASWPVLLCLVGLIGASVAVAESLPPPPEAPPAADDKKAGTKVKSDKEKSGGTAPAPPVAGEAPK
jgi:hypothetical protein